MSGERLVLVHGLGCEPVKQLSYRALVVELSKELETLLVETNRGRIPGQVRRSGEDAERARP